MNYNKEHLDWFTPKSIADAFMHGLGITYTDETKSAEMGIKLRNITECTFLKRGFKKLGLNVGAADHYLSPLELDTIRDSVRWMRKNIDGDSETNWAKNVELMLEELSMHDQYTYQSVGLEIIRACNKLSKKPGNLPLSLPNQAVLQMRVATREMIY